MFLSFAAGVLVASYVGNADFRKSVDTTVQDLAKKAVKSLNAGGNQDAQGDNDIESD